MQSRKSLPEHGLAAVLYFSAVQADIHSWEALSSVRDRLQVSGIRPRAQKEDKLEADRSVNKEDIYLIICEVVMFAILD